MREAVLRLTVPPGCQTRGDREAMMFFLGNRTDYVAD
jgi:hypothetical protein